MEPQISVWVCREEKLISGLSRRTTCADVVRALLEEQGGRARARRAGMLAGAPETYCIVEKWRGFERSLPNKTKLLRLWAAWGDEQDNVRFVLVRSGASLPNAGPRSAEARVVRSGESPGGGPGAARAGLGLPPERQRRLVRKAFRKLAKLNKQRQREAPSGERLETLVHLVLSQDHTIRQQLQRLRELDREIERYEARTHLERVKRHGANYVQDTYLEPEPEPERLEEYARKCQELLRLQEQRRRQEERLERVAGELQDELNRRWMKRRREEPAGEPEGGELLWERERLKTQLGTSLYVGLRLNADLEAVKGELALSRRAWEARERELQRLLDTLNTLDFADPPPAPSSLPPQDGSGRWKESDGDGEDSDTDTGLSSMHSQDSDSLAVCESLV